MSTSLIDADRRVSASFLAAYLEALLAFDTGGADRVVRQALDAGLAPAVVHTCVIESAMKRVGDLWEAGELTVADEHLATGISHRALLTVSQALTGERCGTRERVALAAVEGEEHVLGLQMVSDVLEGAGFRVRYFGANLPTAGIAEAVRAHRPHVFGLSVTLATSVEEAGRALAEARPPDPEVGLLIGGAAAPLVAEEADGVLCVEDARGVEAAVEALVAGRA